jgi:hypothetical protein
LRAFRFAELPLHQLFRFRKRRRTRLRPDPGSCPERWWRTGRLLLRRILLDRVEPASRRLRRRSVVPDRSHAHHSRRHTQRGFRQKLSSRFSHLFFPRGILHES